MRFKQFPSRLPLFLIHWGVFSLLYRYDQQSLSVDFLELLEPFIPSDYELKLLVNYEKDGRPLEELADEDQFMLQFGKIPRLKQRINTLTFMGNFPDTVKRLQPVSFYHTRSNINLHYQTISLTMV